MHCCSRVDAAAVILVVRQAHLYYLRDAIVIALGFQKLDGIVFASV